MMNKPTVQLQGLPAVHRPSRQRGAALYVALIMLVLLALIGIVGMQVSGMQERMSANYQAVNLAFQQAEGLVRQVECTLDKRPDCAHPVDIVMNCEAPFDVGEWVESQNLSSAPAASVRRIDSCIGVSDSEMGGPVSELDAVYQITVYATDANVPGKDPTSVSVVETIFKH